MKATRCVHRWALYLGVKVFRALVWLLPDHSSALRWAMRGLTFCVVVRWCGEAGGCLLIHRCPFSVFCLSSNKLLRDAQRREAHR
jgi:hypothetical protein